MNPLSQSRRKAGVYFPGLSAGAPQTSKPPPILIGTRFSSIGYGQIHILVFGPRPAILPPIARLISLIHFAIMQPIIRRRKRADSSALPPVPTRGMSSMPISDSA
jgi:hypothetical protein